MGKRFTDSEKFRDTWYRKLTPKHKCVWEYLLAECSLAGILDVDYEAMSFHIGETIKKEDLDIFKDKISWLSEDKIFIVNFVKFQQKELNINQKSHKKIIEELEKNEIALSVCEQGIRYTLDTPLKGYQRCTGNSNSNSKGNSSSKPRVKEEEKKEVVNLEKLSIEHISDWLEKKRAVGLYLTVDEDLLLEKFKNYCQAKDKRYKDYVAAFRNSFNWDNPPTKRKSNNKNLELMREAMK